MISWSLPLMIEGAYYTIRNCGERLDIAGHLRGKVDYPELGPLKYESRISVRKRVGLKGNGKFRDSGLSGVG